MNLLAKHYNAFISYSHADATWGKWVHKKLETFRFPEHVRQKYQLSNDTLYPIFRDREELPGSSNLSDELIVHLGQSLALLVICSPRSATSLWVNEEVLNYQRLSPSGPIVALLIDGQSKQPDVKSSFNLPASLKGLVDSQSALVKIVDARKSGKSSSTLINLIHALKSISKEELSQIRRSRIRKKLFVAAALTFLISIYSYLTWYKIQSQLQAKFLAQSNESAIQAQQYLGQNNHTAAINTLLKALPADPNNPDRPVADKVLATLNNAMSKPVLKIKRYQLENNVEALLDTEITNHKIIVDESNTVYLVDLFKGELIWSKRFEQINQWGINSNQELVVRTSSAMVTVSLRTGERQCQLELSSYPSVMQVGAVPWIVNDHITEWHYFDPNADYKTVNRFEIINTLSCDKKFDLPVPLTRYVYLLDVVSPSRLQFAFQSYDLHSQSTFTRFVEWDTEEKPNLVWKADFSGTMQSLFGGFLNNHGDYEGPVVFPESKTDLLYIALETKPDEYYFVAYDKMVKKVVYSIPLSTKPISIVHDKLDSNRIVIGLAESQNKKNHFVFIDKRKQRIIDQVSRGNTFGAFAGRYPLSGDKKHWFLNQPGVGYLIVNSKSNTQYDIHQGTNSVITVDSGWLSDSLAFAVEKSGEIFTFHLTEQSLGTRILNDRWLTLYRKITDSKHLIMIDSKTLSWYNPRTNEVSDIVEYNWGSLKKVIGVFQHRYLVVKTPNDMGNTIDVIDLEEKVVAYNVRQKSTAYKLLAFDEYLIVETDFNHFDVYIYQKSQPIFSVDKSDFLTFFSSSGLFVALNYNLYGDGLTIESLRRNGVVEESQSFPVEIGISSEYFPTSLADTLLIKSTVAEEQKLTHKFRLLNVQNGRMTIVGIYQSAALNSLESPDYRVYGDIVHFGRDHILGGNRSDFVLNIRNGEAMSFDTAAGERLLYISEDLLSHQQVIIEKDSKLFLKHLSNSTLKPIPCNIVRQTSFYGKFSYSAKTDRLIVVNAAQNGSDICVFSREAGTVVANLKLPNSSMTQDSLSGSNAIHIEHQTADSPAWLMTNFGLKFDLSAEQDWKTLVKRAQALSISNRH